MWVLYDTFIVRRLHNCFQLALHKHFDGSFQIQSQLFVVLANLDSRENCEDLFQATLMYKVCVIVFNDGNGHVG